MATSELADSKHVFSSYLIWTCTLYYLLLFVVFLLVVDTIIVFTYSWNFLHDEINIIPACVRDWWAWSDRNVIGKFPVCRHKLHGAR